MGHLAKEFGHFSITVSFHRLGQIGEPRCGVFLQLDRIGEKFSDIVHDQTSVESGKDGFIAESKAMVGRCLAFISPPHRRVTI